MDLKHLTTADQVDQFFLNEVDFQLIELRQWTELDGPQSVDIHGPEETIDLLKEILDTQLRQIQTDHERQIADLVRSAHTSNPVRFVYQDRPQYLLCLTSPYFDRAQIQWYGLLNISGQWHPIAPLESFTRVLATGQKNFILASMIQLVSTNSERTPLRWTAIKCVNKADSSTDYPDGPVDVTSLDSKKPAMKLIDLKSYAAVAKLSVEKDDQSTVISNTATHLGPDGMIRSSLNIQLTRERNGRFYSLLRATDPAVISGVMTRLENEKRSDQLPGGRVGRMLAFCP
ncbi:unnamed protein product [Echinostoma caproni]|uniref:START domain-containing protein n=1 Tax=Echinostoma caproni TaxID=27848 RepID=A0A183B6D3_9TREM|nr:unnamed protein product [Echinostoma caproni]